MKKPVKRRAYSSTVRQEQAALTRTRILEAADDLFASNGYARATMKQIADRAGVSSDTVYAVFGSKGRVLTGLLDLRLTASTGLTSALEIPEAVAIRGAKDQREQITLYVRFTMTTYDRAGRVHAMLRSAATVDEEMSSIYAEMQTYRERNTKTIAGWIAKNGRLRVTKERAGEIMWALGSPELASMLREQQGWDAGDYAEWLEETLTSSLLPAARSTGRKLR